MHIITRSFTLISLATLLAFFMVIPVAGQTAAVAPTLKTSATPAPGFGLKVAGTYLMKAPVLPGINILWTFSADGTLTSSTSSDFGSGNPSSIGINSPAYGIWKRLGQQEVLIRFLQLHFTEDGTHDHIERVDVIVTFDQTFSGFSASRFTSSFFDIDQDPTNPDEMPAQGSFNIDLDVVATRLTAD